MADKMDKQSPNKRDPEQLSSTTPQPPTKKQKSTTPSTNPTTTPTKKNVPAVHTITYTHLEWYYLKIQLVNLTLSEAFFKNLVQYACQEAFGVIGAGAQIDLLSFDYDNQIGILRVPTEYVLIIIFILRSKTYFQVLIVNYFSTVVSLRNAMTLLNKYEGKDCRIDVLSVSPHLSILAMDNHTKSYALRNL